ncbi:MAG: energy transducer TonB [Armatimonadota bacterium]
MRDNKILTYAIAGSVAIHLVVLGFIGKTSAAKPIAVDQLKVVQVDLAKAPDDTAARTSAPEQPKPEVEPAQQVETPYVPPPSKMVTSDERHKYQPPSMSSHERRMYSSAYTHNNPGRPGSTRPAGDHGGALRGITAPNGQDLGYVPTGRTPVGWVPGADNGRGIGSGSGAGVGHPDPEPDARSGHGITPAPEPEPAPPPQPRMVTVTVCEVSGMLSGPYCNRTCSRSFREGSEPSSRCTMCKAPEPVHVNRLADRAEPELIKDCEPQIPEIDESGDYIVRISYTVDTDGDVSDIEIVDSSGVRAIDKAVRSAASKMRYKPAVQDGQPRSVRIRRKYRIRI